MNTVPQFSLRSIGNFVGLRLKELSDALLQKADRTEVSALRRWYVADDAAGMTGLSDARAKDLCIRSDTGSVHVLDSLPPSSPGHWRPVLRGGSGGYGGAVAVPVTLPLSGEIAPVLIHGMGRLPISVWVVDREGRSNYADYTVLDVDSIRLNFTEAIEGTCHMVFVG